MLLALGLSVYYLMLFLLLLLYFNFLPASVVASALPPTQFFIFIYAFDSCVAFISFAFIVFAFTVSVASVASVCVCVCEARLIVQSAAFLLKICKVQAFAASSYLLLAFYYDSHIHKHTHEAVT